MSPKRSHGENQRFFFSSDDIGKHANDNAAKQHSRQSTRSKHPSLPAGQLELADEARQHVSDHVNVKAIKEVADHNCQNRNKDAVAWKEDLLSASKICSFDDMSIISNS